MDPTHNVGKFLGLLEWFLEAHLLYLKFIIQIKLVTVGSIRTLKIILRS